MSATITWSISDLERYTSDGIVYTVHYRVDATDGVYKSGAYGSVGLEAPAESDSVIPYADLTPEIVISWVKDSLNTENGDAVTQVEAALQKQIDEQAAPTTSKGTPW